MTLSLEQFKALRQKGLSTEQITKFDTQPQQDNPMLDMAGIAIGVGGQAIQKGLESQPLPARMIMSGVGAIAKPIGQAYQGAKDMYLNSPLNPLPGVMSDKPVIQGNMPIKQFDPKGQLETIVNVPISESPQSIFKHLQSLGIDIGLGAGAEGKIAEFNEPSNMLTRASKHQTKAENLLAEVLQPKTGEMEDAIKYSLPEVTKVKDYSQLAEKFGQSKDSKMARRNFVIASSKKKIGEEYLKPLNDLYSEMVKDPQLSKKAGPLADAIHSEYEYLFSKPGRKISLQEAEIRKERLQKLTEPLLESGGADISDPAMKQAWDKIRYGFRKAISAQEPEVEALNKPYGGLNEATVLAETQRDLALKEGVHNPIKNLIAHVFRGSKTQTGAALVREAFRRESNIAGKTGKIAKLYKKSQTLRELASKKLP